MRRFSMAMQSAIAMAVSASILYGVVDLVSSSDHPDHPIKQANTTYQTAATHPTDQPSLSKTHKLIEQTRRYNDCLESHPIERQQECDELLKEPNARVERQSDKSDRSSYMEQKMVFDFIDGIYVALWALLSAALFFGFELRSPNVAKATRDAILHYAMNTPTLLGIAGTMYAMATFAASSSSAMTLMATFRANITDAIGTSVAGIVVYLISAAVYLAHKRKEANYER